MSFVRNLCLLNSSKLNILEFKSPCTYNAIKSLIQNNFPVATQSFRQYSDDSKCCYVPVPPDHCKPPGRCDTATFCDVAHFSLSQRKMVVDVRECEELARGKIPNSIHIPSCHVPNALTMPKKDYVKKYGCQKPDKSTDLIFYSNSGCRSAVAMDQAYKLGYCYARNYKGGYNDFMRKSSKNFKDICPDKCKGKKK